MVPCAPPISLWNTSPFLIRPLVLNGLSSVRSSTFQLCFGSSPYCVLTPRIAFVTDLNLSEQRAKQLKEEGEKLRALRLRRFFGDAVRLVLPRRNKFGISQRSD